MSRRLILRPSQENNEATHLASFETSTYGAFKFYISSAKAGVIKVDWGDSIIEDINVGISSTTFSHTFKTYGYKTVKILSSSVDINYLGVYSCSITNLDVSNIISLKKLYCYSNLLKILDISKNTNLEILYCYNNKIQELKLENNTKLTSLNCYSNSLRTLDIRPCEKMTSLYCYNNSLERLDLAGNLYLQYLHCYNNKIQKLDIDYCALRDLLAYNNQLTSISIERTTTVSNVQISNNLITSLNVMNNGPLVTLTCDKNLLSGQLNLSNNTKLTTLNCSYNKLNDVILPNKGRSTSTLTNFNLGYNSLTSTIIDKILTDVNLYYGKPSKKTLLLNNQLTPYTPSTTEGISAKNSLILKGWILSL